MVGNSWDEPKSVRTGLCETFHIMVTYFIAITYICTKYSLLKMKFECQLQDVEWLSLGVTLGVYCAYPNGQDITTLKCVIIGDDMKMSRLGDKMESVVCVVLYLYCVLCVSGRENRFIVPKNSIKDGNYTAKVGSDVIFVCAIPLRDRQIATWRYDRDVNQSLAISSETGTCNFYIKPNERFVKDSCTRNSQYAEYKIVITNIQYTDEGNWYCFSQSGRSQNIFIDVITNDDTTNVPKATSTSSQKPNSPTNRPISVTVKTTTASEPITDVQTETPSETLNLIPVVGGAVGGMVVLVLIITIVAVVLKARTGEKKSTKSDRSPDGQNRNFGAYEEDIGDQYAKVADMPIPGSKSSEGYGRKENGSDGQVVAENPMYESYGQEDGGDHVPDVYSVVQKPLKSQSSTNDGGKDPNPLVTDDNVTDVYSVVQKPSKLQESDSVPDGTKDAQLSGSDEMGDVYSVVQKPAKG